MRQYEAVLAAMEKLGGSATLAQLYSEVVGAPGFAWKTKTPYATIRQIVQIRPEVFRIRPGFYGLCARRAEILEQIARSGGAGRSSDHAQWQGMLLRIGNVRRLRTFAPDQDRRRLFEGRELGEWRNLQALPQFATQRIVSKARTVDVIWFEESGMPHSFFEVECTTGFQTSLLKFCDFAPLSARRLIVAPAARRPEFNSRMEHEAFRPLREKVSFYATEWLAREYEREMERSNRGVAL